MVKETVETFAKKTIFPVGKPNDDYAQFFIGQSYLEMLTETGVSIANVTFEPSCRNNWHVHRASKDGGQILLCIAGEGWYQEYGKPPRALKAGDVVVIPPNVKHWHGAKENSWFSHLAIAVQGENVSTEWLEPVADEIYKNLK